MNAKLEGKRLIFTKYTREERDKVETLLSWEGDEYNEPETLLFEEEGKLFTLWGLHDTIGKEINLEVEGLPEIKYEDVRVDPEMFNFGPKPIILHNYQTRAMEKSLILKMGINEIPTSGGKTECILGTIKILFDSSKADQALVMTPTIGSVEQFYERSLLRGFPKGSVGRIHGFTKEFEAPILVGTINSLIKGYREDGRLHDIIKKSNAVFVNECQHLRAETWAELAMGLDNAKYLISYSGSPFQEDEVLDNSGDSIIYGLSGQIIFSVPLQYLVAQGWVAEPIVYFKSMPGTFGKFPGRFTRIYNEQIVQNERRNGYIIDFAKRFKTLEFPTLISVARKEHAWNLFSKLEDPKTIYISGGGKAAVYNSGGIDEYTIDYNTFRGDFDQGMYDTLIATQVFNEDIDIPAVQALILGGAGRSTIMTRQRLGRGLRKKKDLINRVYVVDFLDRGHVYLYAQAKKRQKIYEKLGVKIVWDELQFNRLLHDHMEATK